MVDNGSARLDDRMRSGLAETARHATVSVLDVALARSALRHTP